MSTIRNPVGPQPSSVYWRRRLVVLLGLLAVVVIVVLIVVRPGSGSGDGAGTPTPPATPSSTPVIADDSARCDPSVIAIEAVTDADSYPAGQQPQLSMAITNRGSHACTFDVGPGAQEYVIMSGSDLIWKSTDCLGGDSLDRVLQPDETLTTTPLAWDRTRSNASACSTTGPAVVAGGATYRLSVKLGEVSGPTDKPFLLY